MGGFPSMAPGHWRWPRRPCSACWQARAGVSGSVRACPLKILLSVILLIVGAIYLVIKGGA